MTTEVRALAQAPKSPLPAGEGWVREKRRAPPNPNENQTTPPSFRRKPRTAPLSQPNEKPPFRKRGVGGIYTYTYIYTYPHPKPPPA